MSHNTVIKDVKIADVSCLQSAIANLQKQGVKINFNPDRKTFRTYIGQPNKCDAVIELPGAQYDVGLVKQPDGTMLPVFDHDLRHGNPIACELRPNDKVNRYDDSLAIAKLVQEYSAVVAEKELALKGMTSMRQTTDDGAIQVVAEYVE